ncbi:MAG: class I mannose-6-phosphate isomerase [Selenomonadaceae bacterium]|nr:class I mannose-6-phosphate isomerase [Selenomonadaceae bacterium]
MLILDTVAHDTIWGGEKLLPYAKENCKRIGHLYSLCSEKGLENRILNGKYKGMTFDAYFKENKRKFGLDKYDEFPLIIALVEARENLSIQVHPDDVVAKEEEGAAYGKNESWLFIEAPTSGFIYNGCIANDKEEVKKSIDAGDCLSVVDKLPVRAGDYVYVEGGTLHAISAGAYLYEIEENSPWTYRFYDFDRTDANGNKRELHEEKALKALKCELKSKKTVMGDEPIEERRYIIKKLTAKKSYVNESGTLECITVIEGEFEAESIKGTTGTTVVLEPGESLAGDLNFAIVARPK